MRRGFRPRRISLGLKGREVRATHDNSKRISDPLHLPLMRGRVKSARLDRNQKQISSQYKNSKQYKKVSSILKFLSFLYLTNIICTCA